jgi:hypothetical protein
MVFRLFRRVMVFGYFLFIGYQLLTSLSTSTNTEFVESVNKLETLFDKQFQQVYKTLPQLVQYKLTKYPLALIAFSTLSVFSGGFLGGLFELLTLASHALITYLTNGNLVNLVMSINPQMDFIKFAINLDLEIILLLAKYLGVLSSVANSFFACAKRTSCEEVEINTQSPRMKKENSEKKKKKELEPSSKRK